MEQSVSRAVVWGVWLARGLDPLLNLCPQFCIVLGHRSHLQSSSCFCEVTDTQSNLPSGLPVGYMCIL